MQPRLNTGAWSGWMPAPRRPLGAPGPFDSPEPAGQLRGAAAERSRRAEPPGQLDQVPARAVCPRWGRPGSWSGRRRRPHLTRGPVGGEGERGPRPLPLAGSDPLFLRGLGRGQRDAPCSRHPWSRRRELRGGSRAPAGGWAATLSAAGMRWKPPRPFPGESPKGRSGAWLGRRLLGPASEGAARLLTPAAPSRGGQRPRTLVLQRGIKGSEGQPEASWLSPGPTWWCLGSCPHGRLSTFSAITEVLGPAILAHQNTLAKTPPGP